MMPSEDRERGALLARLPPDESKAPGNLAFPGACDGGRTRTRTLDPLIKSQLLYQLSYAPASEVGR